jgi:hypothetical protein
MGSPLLPGDSERLESALRRVGMHASPAAERIRSLAATRDPAHSSRRPLPQGGAHASSPPHKLFYRLAPRLMAACSARLGSLLRATRAASSRGAGPPAPRSPLATRP